MYRYKTTSTLLRLKIPKHYSKDNVDPDKMPKGVVSNLSCHCMQRQKQYMEILTYYPTICLKDPPNCIALK